MPPAGFKPSSNLLVPLLREAEDYLAAANVDSPRLSAQVAAACVMGKDRLALFLEPKTFLDQDELLRFRDLVGRRGLGEPVAYLTGVKEFYGLDFSVNPHTLIPRPETEGLVELALKLFSHEDRLVFADIGTGSGCIAVTLAQFLPKSVAVAADISPGALRTARENAVMHRTEDRIRFVLSDYASALKKTAFDLVVSNPPYLSEEEFREISHEVSGFEPRTALVCPEQGLYSYRVITSQAAEVLKPGGWLIAEIGYTQAEAVLGMLDNASVWERSAVLPDLAGLDRIVAARLRS